MRKGYVRMAVWGDINPVASNMRSADRAEVFAASGSTPEKALREGLLATVFGARTMAICLDDGTPVSLFGVAPSGQPDVGVVWLLATDDLKQIQTQFIRECPRYIAEISRGYRVVYNLTDARNTLHHRWLRWCGFTILKRHETFGPEGRPFLELCKITENIYV